MRGNFTVYCRLGVELSWVSEKVKATTCRWLPKYTSCICVYLKYLKICLRGALKDTHVGIQKREKKTTTTHTQMHNIIILQHSCIAFYAWLSLEMNSNVLLPFRPNVDRAMKCISVFKLSSVVSVNLLQ